MTIHRRTTPMGRERIVGTTLKQAANLPKDVVADEKHRTLSGETGYLAPRWQRRVSSAVLSAWEREKRNALPPTDRCNGKHNRDRRTIRRRPSILTVGTPR